MKKRRLIIFVAVLALVALGSLYYAAVAPAVVGKDRVAEAFAAALKDGPGMEVRYTAASFKLFPRPAVALTGAAFFNRSGKEVIRADEVKLGLSYLGFVALKPSLATVELVRMRADLAPGDVSFGEAGAAEPFRGTVLFKEGFVRYVGSSRTVLLDGLSGRVRCKVAWGEELELRGKLNADKLKLAAAEGEAAGGMAIAAEGSLRFVPEAPGGRVFFDELDFLFGKARLSVAGEVQTGPGEKDVDLTLHGKKMALAQVLPALAPRFGEADLKGEIDLDLTVKGKWGEGVRPEVRGELEVKKAALEPDDGEGVTNCAVKVRFEGEKYVVESFHGQTKKGGFKGYGTVRPEASWPFQLKIEGAMPLEVAAIVLGVPEAYMMEGTTQLDLDVDGELSAAGRTSVDGTVELVGCQVRVKPFVAPFKDLNGTAYCDGYKIKAGKIKGTLAGGSFEIGGSWQGFETPRLDFVVVADDVNLDAALPPRDGKGHSSGGAGPLGLPGKDVTAKGRVKIKKCRVLTVDTRKLDADFDYTAGILSISKLDFSAYDGKVKSQMTVYLKGRPKYTCSASVRDARLGLYLTENKYLENVVTGRFSADVTFSAEGTTYDEIKTNFGGKGSVELEGGRVAELPLLAELAKWSRIDLFDPLQVSELWALCDARDGVIRTSDLRIENSDMLIEAAGEVTLGKQVNFTVRTTFEKKAADRLAREGKALALVRDEDGKAHFNFVVAGEASKPAFQLDAGSMLGAAGEVPGEGEEEEESGDIGDLF
ncbi:MAG: AsmA-like C-terminal region-containing protein [Candidatus Zixiibacteriota bacterium]|jgi:hypothetical protein